MAPRKVREYYDARTGENSIEKCFVLTNLHRFQLAQFIKHHGNKSVPVQEFIVSNWRIYQNGSKFDPNKYRSGESYPLGSRAFKRLTSIFYCPACEKEHPRGEGMSRESIFKWRKNAEKQAEGLGEEDLDYKEIDWKDARKLTEAGIDFHYRGELKYIYDQVLMQVRYGNETPYDSLDHMDLHYLQYFIQYYRFNDVSIYDALCMMDLQKYCEEAGSPEQIQAFDDWLTFRPWEGDKELDAYRDAISRGAVAPLMDDSGKEVPVMLHLQFIRPTDCMQFNLPSQIFDYFLKNKLNRMYPDRNVDVIGIDPWDEFVITQSMDLDSENNVRRQWEVENVIDRKEKWIVLTDEVF